MVARFGAYEILHALKEGGMGAVLLGRRRGPGNFEQLVAIKTIRADYAGVKAIRDMFLDEAAILARLNHPGVATVHDFGEEGGVLYMVMEYVAGIAFRDLAEMRPPPIVMARAIAEACRGLHAAHELHDLGGNRLGLVHRDISPDNLMVGFDGHVKVIDFGIALVKNRQSPVTEIGSVKGKPPYMSPEQVKNEPIDRRSDVFSLAVVLWEMLAGKPLFDGESIFAIAYAVDNQEIVPPSQGRGDALPHGLDAVVMKALDRDLSRRTPSAAAFAEQLEQVIQSAGDESLEAWAERELKKARDEHRAWLTRIVRGDEHVANKIGRASGEHTKLPDLGRAKTAASGAPFESIAGGRPATIAGDGELPPSTSIGRSGTGSFELPTRRRLAPIMLGFLILLAGGTAAYLKFHSHELPRAPADAASMDASLVVAADAGAVADAGVADASVPETPVDAALVDAGHHRTRVDAGRAVARDASPTIVAVPPTSVGQGFINITPRSGGPYVNVVIDGKGAGPAPMLHHKIGAGRHTIQLVDPKSGDILDTQSVDVEDGKSISVTQH